MGSIPAIGHFYANIAPKISFLAEIQGAFYYLLKFVVTKDIFYYHCDYKTPGHFDFNKAYDKIEIQKG